MAQHAYRPESHCGVTVPELIERIGAEGFPIRLMWPDADPNMPFQRVRWSVDDCPTGYLPGVDDDRVMWPGTRSA